MVVYRIFYGLLHVDLELEKQNFSEVLSASDILYTPFCRGLLAWMLRGPRKSLDADSKTPLLAVEGD